MRILEKETKKAFFDELYQLDDVSDGAEETSTISLILAQSKVTASTSTVDSRGAKRRITDDLRFNPPLNRTLSNPHAQVSDSTSGMIPSAKKPQLVALDIDEPSASAFFKEQTPNVTSKQANHNVVGKARRQAGKRKRGQSFNTMPESQQIFKGLAFCKSHETVERMWLNCVLVFLPNNDVAPPRAFRIRKAIEWGASWVQEWKHGITHVHVDKYLSYKDVLLSLKVESMPVSNQISTCHECGHIDIFSPK